MVEWVARGKYAISIGPSMAIPSDFIKMGAPIAFIDVKEPRSFVAEQRDSQRFQERSAS